MGDFCHQNTQNLVLRDYCERKNYKYLLSFTEYGIIDSYLMFQECIDLIPGVNGIVCYSLFMLPENQVERRNFLNTVLDKGGEIHFALEGLKISTCSELERIECIWLIRQTMENCITTIYDK